MANDIIEKVAELVQINKEIKKLTDRKKALEALFLTAGALGINDTKYKSLTFADTENHKVTYTEATKLTIISPCFLRELFGNAYPDLIKETTETSYKFASAAIERMMTGLFTGDYIRSTPAEVLEQLPVGADERRALTKKLKGANFDTDKNSLMTIAGMDEETASDYAYMYAEAVIWETFLTVLQLSGKPVTDETIEALTKGINVALAADCSQKIKIE